MAKSRKTGSHNFFKITVLGSLLLGLIVVTGAVMMPTNTRSNASGDDSNAILYISSFIDENQNSRYDSTEPCQKGVSISTYSKDANFTSGSRATTFCKKYIGISQTEKLIPIKDTVIFHAPSGYSIIGLDTNGTIKKGADRLLIENGDSRMIKVALKKNGNPAPEKPDQPDTSSSCGAPKIDYNWSKGHSKSVTYRFTVKNNCNKKQTYRVWANVNENGTSGWSWKFATGASNKSVQKVLSAGESSGSEVTVYRADNTPKGIYKVTFYAAPCDNANNCNSNSDTNDHKQAKYTTSYRVE